MQYKKAISPIAREPIAREPIAREQEMLTSVFHNLLTGL